MLRTFLLGLACVALLPSESRAQGDLRTAALGQCALENGGMLEDCRIAYRTFGELNADRSNAVLIPTQFMGTSASITEYIGPDGLVDDAEYFVIAVDAFANGVSTSPSNSSSQPGELFPPVSIRDMVGSQHRLVTEVLELPSLRGVVGISMGGMQAFEWAVSYPGFAEKIVSIASSPRLAAYDVVLWETVLRILSIYQECQCEEAVSALMGIAFLTGNSPDYHARISQRDSVPGIINRMDNQPFAVSIAQNLAAQIRAMISHNVAAPYGDSMARAAAHIRADVLVIVTPDDHVVTPAPALEFASVLGVEAIQLRNDCGHNGLRCDGEMLSQATQMFLANHK